MSESNSLTITASHNLSELGKLQAHQAKGPKPTSLNVNYSIDLPGAAEDGSGLAAENLDEKLKAINDAVRNTANQPKVTHKSPAKSTGVDEERDVD